MMLFLPLGLDEAKVDRLPWVSLSIAGLCVLAFLFTWVLPASPMGVEDEELARVLQYALEHPELELDAAFRERFLSPVGQRMYERRRQRAQPPDMGLGLGVDGDGDGEPDGAARAEVDVAALQRALDARCEELLRRADSGPMRRLSLVPERGAAQVGWLTHMFLHFGWMHLLGNLLFFYLVGPLLEDVWGRPLFSGFYLGGGLLAALAHFALEPSSNALMAGASGAVAACMGAFTLRYSGRKVRMGYFIWLVRIWTGTFFLPAWLWGGLWFANEVLDFVLWGNSTGVAVMAHIGGFVFGFGVAAALRTTQVEERLLAPELARRQGVWVEDPLLAQAREALEAGQPEAAREALTRALAARPDAPEVLLALGKLELDEGTATGAARVERALQQLVAREDKHPLWRAVEELGPSLPAQRLRPALAWRVAQAMEEGPEGSLVLAEPLYAAAGAGGGGMAVRALVRAAELRLRVGEAPERARDYLARARAQLTEADGALGERLRALEAEVEGAVARGGARRALDLGPVEPDAPPVPPRIIPCRLLALGDKALRLESGSGQQRTLATTEVLAVAVGMLPLPTPEGAPPRRTVLTDLVVSWGGPGQGPVVLRLNAANLLLAQHYPGLPPREAYARLLADLLERSSATPMPDAHTLSQGPYPHFDSEAHLTSHYYGAAA